mgnify:CR=1 FL=1
MQSLTILGLISILLFQIHNISNGQDYLILENVLFKGNSWTNDYIIEKELISDLAQQTSTYHLIKLSSNIYD